MRISSAGDHIRRVYRDWKGMLANPEFEVRQSLVCWRQYKPSMLPADLTFEDVAQLASDRQYSFQIAADGSLLQLFYVFENDGRTVKNATLAYCEGSADCEREGLYVAEEEVGNREDAAVPENPAVSSVPRWIRIDYSRISSECPIHSNCHMHLSGFPDTRVTLSNLPSPKQFVEVVFAWFYPSAYRTKRLNDQGRYTDKNWMKFINRNSMPCDEKEATKFLVHLRLPLNRWW